MSTFTDFWAKFGKKMDSVTMATEIIIKELSMNYFVLSENKQVQKVSLKSVTRREKQLCSIFTENHWQNNQYPVPEVMCGKLIGHFLQIDA